MDQVNITYLLSFRSVGPTFSEKICKETNAHPSRAHTPTLCNIINFLKRTLYNRDIISFLVIADPRACHISQAVDDYRREPGMQTITIKQLFRENMHVYKIHTCMYIKLWAKYDTKLSKILWRTKCVLAILMLDQLNHSP